jgi:ATP-dependent DNA helicase RecQ
MPGIVYVATRRAAEELAERLVTAGYQAAFYHGGMASGAREQAHEDFTADKIDVMVATSAFGMGIDKANIRWVAHVALPDSPDSYFQEIGRAGRDGAPASALLLWRSEDEAIQRFFTGGAPDPVELRELAAALRTGPQTRKELQEKSGLGPRKLGAYLGLLEQVGAAVSGRGNKMTVPLFAPLPAAAADAAVREHERRQTVTRSRTDMMRGFAQTRNCRSQLLLAYFGEHRKTPCGHCDNDLDGGTDPAPPTAAGPFAVHSKVRHGEWGEGTVMAYEDNRVTVLFDEVGYKTLSVPVVVDNKLLTEV